MGPNIEDRAANDETARAAKSEIYPNHRFQLAAPARFVVADVGNAYHWTHSYHVLLPMVNANSTGQER